MINSFNFFIFYEKYFLWNSFISYIQKSGKKNIPSKFCRTIFYKLSRLHRENTFIMFYEIMDICKYYIEPKVSSIGNVQVPFEIPVTRQYFLGIRLLVHSIRLLVPQKGVSFFILLEKELYSTYLHRSTAVKQKSNYTKGLVKLKGKVSWRNKFLPKQEMLLVKHTYDNNTLLSSEKTFLFKNLKFYFVLLFIFKIILFYCLFLKLFCFI